MINPEKTVCSRKPRKARQYSKKSPAIDRYHKSGRLNQYNILVYLLFFLILVTFIDQLVLLE
ncbi:MAG: hypothetical protein ACXWFP_20235 [Methylobacter sp.]